MCNCGINDLLQEQSTSSHLDAMRICLVTISLSSVLYYKTKRNKYPLRHDFVPTQVSIGIKSTNMLKRWRLGVLRISTHHWHLWARGWKWCMDCFAILVPGASTTARIGSLTWHETEEVSILSSLGFMFGLAPWKSSSLKNAYTVTPQNKPAETEELDLPIKIDY